MAKVYKRYKFLNKHGRGIKSYSGDLDWKIGEWQKPHDPSELSLCNYGLHASKKVYQAFSYVQGDVLAEVECRGKHLDDDDKHPRNAIEAARKVLAHDTAKNRSAARSARSAAWSARSAAWSARSAA